MHFAKMGGFEVGVSLPAVAMLVVSKLGWLVL